jgi:tripartite-type tricarboxylate transporter receptor subunit TctC
MKSAKEEVAVATTGRGGFSHLTASMFFNAIGVKFRDVPYRGEAPAIQDLLSSSVNYYFGNLPGALPHVTSGKIRAFAVTSTARSPAAPAIPTFTELGRPEVVANAWFGLMAPKGTPAEVIAALADALNKAHDDKELQARLAADGATAKRMRPGEFAEYMKRDNERWARVVKAANIDGLEL